MRWLLAAAALAMARLVIASVPAAPDYHDPTTLEHIKTQILTKLGLTSRPMPLGAPPRDVVRQILARAGDAPPPPHDTDNTLREIIAIAHRGSNYLQQVELELKEKLQKNTDDECFLRCSEEYVSRWSLADFEEGKNAFKNDLGASSFN